MTSRTPSISPVGGHATPYDNNNEANTVKMKQQEQEQQQQLLQQHMGSSSAPGALGNRRHTRKSTQGGKNRRSRFCERLHLNSLWSVWYGFFGTFLQAYTAVKCTKRFLRYSVLPWRSEIAVWELHACLLVTGLAVMLLPVFLASAVFKIGNRANDGFKLGRGNASGTKSTGSCKALWRNAGPTAAFLHLTIAAALLLPKLVMEARLLHAGFLPADALWRTDLDFMVVHHDRLVVLSFMTAASSGSTNSVTSTPQLGHTSQPYMMNLTSGPRMAANPAALIAANNTWTTHHSETASTSLAQDILTFMKGIFKMEDDSQIGVDANIDSGFGSSVSVEYLNYALALLVYSVRYPAVFWYTNKSFGVIFSIQLLANSVQSLLSVAGMSVLYKVQVIGAYKALPLLRHYAEGAPTFTGSTPFLLDPHVTLALFTLSSLLVLASSLVLYLYGYTRYTSFLCANKDSHVHISSAADSSSSSGSNVYLTHCAALCTLAATAVTHAPLLHDYTVVYRGSLDGAVLACIVADIGHLFLWVLVWLGFTIKQKWTFKITVTVGKATVRSARSVRLVTDVELSASGRRSSKDVVVATQPLLVVGNGRAYTVNENTSKKAIMSVVQKVATINKQQNQQQPNPNNPNHLEVNNDDSEEQIYWLRPAGAVSPQRSPDDNAGCWFRTRKNSKQQKHKVTFNEASSTSNLLRGGSKTSGNRCGSGPINVDDDDGDYATLRELPLPVVRRRRIADPEDDTTSEEGKLLECVRDDRVTYASTSRADLLPPDDPSPLLTPEPLSEHDESSNEAQQTSATNVTVHTPRCLRRTDSGMPHDELNRSDSESNSSSSGRGAEASPPDETDTSSGVHSTHTSNSQHTAVYAASATSDLGVQTIVLQRNSPVVCGAAPNASVYQDMNEVRGIPAVIVENAAANTVVIRRGTDAQPLAEPFGRSTNMRMTSFTEHSATLPHYPTQPPPPSSTQPHCSTMPHQHNVSVPAATTSIASTSCYVYPRPHTTLPTHHNGVRLLPSAQPQHQVKRVHHIINGRLNYNNAA